MAEITFLDEQTVRNLVKRYKDGGIDGLLKDEYDGRSFKLTPEQRKELERHLDDNLYRDCQGVVNHVPETFGVSYSVSGMRALFAPDHLKTGESRIQMCFLPPYAPNLNLIERVWKFFRKKVMNNRYHATFKEFTEEALMFFECLSEYADELRTLLTHNFQLFGQNTGK